MIIRLWPQHHRNEADVNDLLAALKRNRAACDEVWFCTEMGFPSLETHMQSSEVMADVAKKFHVLEIKTGLQIANTIGHGLSLLQDDSAAKWSLMIDADGLACSPTPCPRSKDFLSYIEKMTLTYASWQPSSIWIDDDLRMNQHGQLKYGCFCSVCVSQFSKEQKKRFNRKSLVMALQHPKDGKIRLAWTQFNSESLVGIAAVVAKATQTVAPNCRLGFQQLGHEQFLYSGATWNPTLETLAYFSKRPAGTRLGHGYYTDHSPRQMINKAFKLSRQIARLSNCVDQICPEIEGFTHNAFGKSAYGMAIESALDLAIGCNSLSYAIICSGHEPMAWYETLLKRLVKYRLFYDKIAAININTSVSGIDVRLGMNHVSRPLQPKESPFSWSAVKLDSLYDLASLGLPLCTDAKKSNGVILHADAVAGFSDKELNKILSKGVMMDGLAAERIQERGLYKLLGAKVARIDKPNPFRERISEDSLNAGFAGRLWNASSNNSGAYIVTPIFNEHRALGFYEDRLEIGHGLSTVLVENKVGGRVAIFGYYGWDSAPSGSKRNQYLAAADWISGFKLPVVIKSLAQVMVVPRVNAKGQLVSVFLLNASIDKTPPLELELRGVNSSIVNWFTLEGKNKKLSLVYKGHGNIYKTPSITGWSVAYLSLNNKTE